MEVTPLLWSLYLDYDEAMKVYEDEKNKFEYTGTDYGMDLYGRANIDQVRYKRWNGFNTRSDHGRHRWRWRKNRDKGKWCHDHQKQFPATG